jgi:hypothetical protein
MPQRPRRNGGDAHRSLRRHRRRDQAQQQRAQAWPYQPICFSVHAPDCTDLLKNCGN